MNNPEEDDDQLLLRLRESKPRYAVFQRERGESGTEHFQGFVSYSDAKSLSAAKSVISPRAHLEPRRGSPVQAWDYCCKDDGRVAGPFILGERPSELAQGSRTDLAAACRHARARGYQALVADGDGEFDTLVVKYSRGLRELSNQCSFARGRPQGDAPDVILLVGPPGCGKSRAFYESCVAGEQYVLPVTGGDIWLDGYDMHPDVLIDDFSGNFPLRSMLRILDRYHQSVQVKGGFVNFAPRRIFVTTNIHPSCWYNYATREGEYAALCRRFTEIRAWVPSTRVMGFTTRIYEYGPIELRVIKRSDREMSDIEWSSQPFFEGPSHRWENNRVVYDAGALPFFY